MGDRKELINMIFSGNSGSGKKTLCYAYLREIYGDGIYNIRSVNIKNDDKEISYLQSNYHIEIDLSIYKSSEKIKVIEFIKKYVNTINISNNYYKLIIFLNSEKICENIFFMLRRIIEKTTNTSRYIFITKNYSLMNKEALKADFDTEIPYWKSSLNECVQLLNNH